MRVQIAVIRIDAGAAELGGRGIPAILARIGDRYDGDVVHL